MDLTRSIILALVSAIVLIGCSDSSGGGGSGGGGGGATTPGAFTQQRFVDADLPQRDYYVYVPGSLPSGPVPLVVYLHGCNQTATDAAIGTRWNEVADRNRIVVVYPEQFNPNNTEFGQEQIEQQLTDGNGSSCWNWFRPEHIMRGAGEAATIAGITREVMARSDINIHPNRVYVMGTSAGGVMSSVMGATYPDLYAAISVVAGCGYPGCVDDTGALAVQAMGEHARRLPVIFFHGSLDPVTPLSLGRQGLRQWLGSNDLIDNGDPDFSVSPLPAQTFSSGLDESLADNLGDEGDLCIRPDNLPCPGGILGKENYPFTVERYVDANDCPLIDFWTIHGLGHNYPGGNTEGSFTDPLGPNISIAALGFFLSQPRDGVFEQGLIECATLPLPLPLPLP